MKKIISILIAVTVAVLFSASSLAQTAGEYVHIICKNGESYSGVLVSSNNVVLKINVKDGNERLIYVEDIVKVNRIKEKDEAVQPVAEASKESSAPVVSAVSRVFTEKYVNKHIGQKANIILSKGKSLYGVYILGSQDQYIITNEKPLYEIRNRVIANRLKDVKAIELLDVDPGFKLNIDLSSFDEIQGHCYDITLEDGTIFKDAVILYYDIFGFGVINCKINNGRFKKIPLLDIKELVRKY